MDEYAISRLMFFCPMAAKEPSAIEAMATNTMICCHCTAMVGNARHGDAHEQRHGGDFGRGGKERRDRGRRALIDVRRPHMERHRRDLEAEPGEQEHETERQAEPALRGGLRDAGNDTEPV